MASLSLLKEENEAVTAACPDVMQHLETTDKHELDALGFDFKRRAEVEVDHSVTEVENPSEYVMFSSNPRHSFSPVKEKSSVLSQERNLDKFQYGDQYRQNEAVTVQNNKENTSLQFVVESGDNLNEDAISYTDKNWYTSDQFLKAYQQKQVNFPEDSAEEESTDTFITDDGVINLLPKDVEHAQLVMSDSSASLDSELVFSKVQKEQEFLEIDVHGLHRDEAVAETDSEEYFYPDFPEVPPLQSDLDFAIVDGFDDESQDRVPLKESSCEQKGESIEVQFKEGTKINDQNVSDTDSKADHRTEVTPSKCSRHANEPPDFYDETFKKFLSSSCAEDAKIKDETGLSKENTLWVSKDKSNICGFCSKKVLSYIAILQDFLDNVVVDIVRGGGKDGDKQCFWCVKERLQQAMIPFRVNNEEEAFKVSQTSDLGESVPVSESFAHFPECNCGVTLKQQDSSLEQHQSQQDSSLEQHQSQWCFNMGGFNFSEEIIKKEIFQHSTSCPRRHAMEAWISQQGSKSSVDQYHQYQNLEHKKSVDLHNGEKGHDNSSSHSVSPHFENSCLHLINPESRLPPVHSGILSTSHSPVNQKIEHPSPINQESRLPPSYSGVLSTSHSPINRETEHPSPQGTHPSSLPSCYSTPVQVHYSPLPRGGYNKGYFSLHLQESNKHDSYGGSSEVNRDREKSRPEEWRVHHPPHWAKSSFSAASDQSETAQNSHTSPVPHAFSYEVTDGSQWKTLPRPKSWDKMVDFVRDWLPCPPEPEKLEQAYVTIASNNLCALGCIVLGNSLRLSGTNRTLVVLITDGVCRPLRHMLATVFHIVQPIRLLGTQGTTKLALLDQPELGVSFTKLHIWRLTQFSKCVFLSPDTVVVQNCDELFERDEISAVPDIGWPDCFNSGVFVYVPAMETFCGLIEFAEQQGSFDGGDQGLLNMYFRNWALNISHKLPFIYNLMANVSYTYTPAFKQFGRNVKIVHFFGSYKPWHVKFHPQTGQMSPSANVHPTYAQFVQFWLSIFNKRVFPLLSEDIRTHAHVRKYVTAEELISFFPSPVTQAVESLPTPPSFRTYPDIITDESGSVSRPTSRKSSRDESFKISHTSKDLPEMAESGSVSRPTSQKSRDESLTNSVEVPPEAPSQNISNDESLKPTREEKSTVGVNIDVEENLKELTLLEETNETEETSVLPPEEKSSKTFEPTASSEKLTSEENITKKTDIPGADVGDFRGMFAWEQGRMDYLGQDSSDNILKRLDFLMKKPQYI
ncbi:uncharacterized protein LOC143250814 isoform X2 [Tachypleus tridentatus]